MFSLVFYCFVLTCLCSDALLWEYNASITQKIQVLDNLGARVRDGQNCYLNVQRKHRQWVEMSCKNETIQNTVGNPIPPVLHQMWKTKDVSTHSKDAVQNTRLISRFAPDFLHVLWTDAEIIEFISLRYPHLLQYYKLLNLNIKR